MTKDYRQFCGLAKAASVLGERWALLVLRDLSLGPRRFGELQQGLPGVPTTVLTTRLRELEEQGVVTRTPVDRPGRGLVYALTDHGRELVPVLDALGRWGARRMIEPQADDTMTDASLAAALRAAYQPAGLDDGVSVAVVAGPAQAWARTADGALVVGAGAPESAPDLTITTGPQMRALLAGLLSPREALDDGAMTVDGPVELFERFASAFHVPADPALTPFADSTPSPRTSH